METLHKTSLASQRMRTRIVAGVAGVAAMIWILTILLPDNIIFNTPIAETITSGIAMATAIVVVAKQKAKGLYGRTYVALAIGLTCWFAGEMIWMYDNVIIGNEPTHLSMADVPWLALYAFFGYYTFKTYRFFSHVVNRYHIFAVVSMIAIVIAYTTYVMLDSFEQIKSPEVAAVRLLYPFGDAAIIIPSVLLLITLRQGLLTYTPWLLASAGFVLIAAADILFTSISALAAFDLSVVATPLYSAGNLALAGSLIWYSKFGIYDQGKTIDSFQKSNR